MVWKGWAYSCDNSDLAALSQRKQQRELEEGVFGETEAMSESEGRERLARHRENSIGKVANSIMEGQSYEQDQETNGAVMEES